MSSSGRDCSIVGEPVFATEFYLGETSVSFSVSVGRIGTVVRIAFDRIAVQTCPETG
jgi:hypothetical protein